MRFNNIQLKRTVNVVLFFLLLSAVGGTKAFAQYFTVDKLHYSVNSDGVSVTVTGPVYGQVTGELLIPETVTYNGLTYSVTVIRDWAFRYCTGFTGNLVIPNSVTTIGDDAFGGCTGFTGNLTIGNSVTTIGDGAFNHCGFTGNLTIGNSVITIGEGAFCNCGFTGGDLNIGNSVTTIGDYAFSACYGFTGNLTIGNSVTTIGNGAFYLCTGFTGNLTIGNSVTTIGDNAFDGCTGFTGNLTMGNSVTTIGDWAFLNCSGFTGNLTIGNSVITIGDYAFSACYGFTGNLTIGNSVTTIGNGAFYLCTGFTGNLTIGNSVTTIGDNAFDGCTGFTGDLTIGNSVTTIGNGAFYLCTGFTGNLTIGNSVTTIGDNAFDGCSGFTGNLTMGNSVTTIGDYAFGGCTGFTGNLTIGNSVTTISSYAFWNCSGFTGNLTMGNSVTTIGDWAFGGCTGFTGNLTIGNSVTTISSYAFWNCSGFTGNLVIPNSVTTIGDEAFVACSGFTGNLVIPNSVTTIGDGAFNNCWGFTGNLVIPNSMTTISSFAFRNCHGFTGNLVIPNSVTTIGDNAFDGCTGFTGNLVIPNSVTTIGDDAFGGCTGFTGNLTIGNSVTTIGRDAFYRCTGFTGNLTIGSSVTTISNYAFRNCTFSKISSHAEMPPTVGYQAFYGIDHDIPVYVPCGSLSDYQNAEGWNEFTNIFGNCFFEITAAVTPANSGTVTGAGTYEMGSTCTLTAIANEGYTFINWKENSEVVSTELEYSFTVTGDRDLVANFVDGSLCNLTIEMYDSYGDGWNGNKLTVSDDLGGYNEITLDSGSSGSTTLLVPDGSHITLGWIMGDYTSECSFNIRYANGDLIYHGENMSSDFSFEFDMVCVEMPATMFIISAIAEPVDGGTVNGTGTYEMGTTCTLTAIDNEGYTFVNWTENDEVVSTEAEFSFTVTGDRNLVANFALPFTITVTTEPAEGGTISGAGEYNYNSTCTLTANANEGYSFYNWSENSQVVSYEAEYTFIVTGDRNLVANFEEIGGDDHAYIDLGLPSGLLWATCNLGANAPEEYGDYFAWGETQPKDVYNWDTYQYYDGSNLTKYTGSDGLTTLLPEDDAATANWGNGWRMPTAEEWRELLNNTTNTWTTQNGVNGRLFTAPNGNSLFLPAAGYRLGSYLYNVGSDGGFWSSSLDTDSPNNARYFYFFSDGYDGMYDNYRYYGRSVRAVRSASPVLSYIINATASPEEGGTISGAGEYDYNSTCTLTATANTGYTFINWTENGEVVSTEAEYSFTVMGDRNLVANFALPFTITVTAEPVEGGTISGTGEYAYNSTCTLTAMANEGYTFIDYTKNGTAVSTNPTYSFTVTEDASYVANFELNRYTITATANPIEGGTVIGTGIYNHGATATLMAAANTGYAFIKWTKDGTVVSTNPTYSFTVTKDVDLVANFKLPGDANGDGIVDALDIVIIVNHIFGLPTEEFVFDNADVNGDGVVDALDIVIIVNIIFSKNS